MSKLEMFRVSYTLFRKLPVASVNQTEIVPVADGIFTTKDIYVQYGNTPDFRAFIKVLKRDFVLSNTELNTTFHKSWQIIRNSPYHELILQQLVHYFTTYGFEAMGITDGPVYIPNEKLDLPEVVEQIPVILLTSIQIDEMKQKLLEVIAKPVALSEETVESLEQLIARFSKTDKAFVITCLSKTKNKELRIRLAAKLRRPPDFPPDMVRYITYRLIGQSQIIQDRSTLQDLRLAHIPSDVKHLLKYKQKDLARVFYRFKNIFLSIKMAGNAEVKNYINRISKMARKYHSPMKVPFYVRMVAEANQSTIDFEKTQTFLENLPIPKLIKIYNLINTLLTHPKERVFRIRNGKIFVSPEGYNIKNKENIIKLKSMIYTTICNRMKQKLKDYPVFLFDNSISVPVPESEKKFVGNVPEGTVVKLQGKYAVFGIHWTNKHKDNQKIRIDLDLSAHSVKTGKIGWDGEYRDTSILFSGDMTDAPPPLGASELLKIDINYPDAFLIGVTFYNDKDLFSQFPNETLDFTFFIGTTNSPEMRESMLLQDELEYRIPLKFNKHRNMYYVGLLVHEKFYFLSGLVSSMSNTMRIPETQVEQLTDFYQRYYENMLRFTDIASELQKGFSEEVFTIFDFTSIENLSREQLISFL